MYIRKYKQQDCKLLANLFYNTVHTVNAADYTKEQLNAWASGTVDLEMWGKSFDEHYTVVAVENGIIAGFGDMDETGYLDRLYVHKDFQRRGIAAAICRELETAVNSEEFVAHASITAKPFFEKTGYTAVKEQQVKRRGIRLTNYVMKKQNPIYTEELK